MSRWERTGASAREERRRFERIIDVYLRDCFEARTPARASELAQKLSANRQHISRTIRLRFDRSLAEILREKQLAEAVRLLTTTPLRLDEVAAAAAFGHPRTFYRAFRKAFGITPARYRAVHKDVSIP
jgi:AraC-like DNA-binding protein